MGALMIAIYTPARASSSHDPYSTTPPTHILCRPSTRDRENILNCLFIFHGTRIFRPLSSTLRAVYFGMVEGGGEREDSGPYLRRRAEFQVLIIRCRLTGVSSRRHGTRKHIPAADPIDNAHTPRGRENDPINTYTRIEPYTPRCDNEPT